MLLEKQLLIRDKQFEAFKEEQSQLVMFYIFVMAIITIIILIFLIIVVNYYTQRSQEQPVKQNWVIERSYNYSPDPDENEEDEISEVASLKDYRQQFYKIKLAKQTSKDDRYLPDKKEDP